MYKKSRYGVILQDIGLLTFLISVFVGVAVVHAGGTELWFENCIMLFFMTVAIVLVTFSKGMAALIMISSQLICYTAYKLFSVYANGAIVSLTSYLWLLTPLVAVGSMKLFCTGSSRLEVENSVLKRQVEELVMVDTLTGLYNLRSFYYDICRQVSYAERNQLPLTLMIIQLRYGQELQRMLSRSHYDSLKQQLVKIIGDAIRVEDRLYSIDQEGALAMILTCDDIGGEFVRNRIRARVGEESAFDKIVDKSSIKVDVQIAYAQYSKEMGEDMMEYKKYVEKELQYDV